MKSIPKQELRWIKEYILSQRSTRNLDHLPRNSNNVHFTPKEKEKLKVYVKERLGNKPLQYILRTQPFLGMTLLLRKPILIPRPETEEITQSIVESIQPDERLKILDLCCGTGCIGLGIIKHCPNCSLVGMDVHPWAIKLSALNARKHNLKATFIQRDVFKDDWIEEVGKVDLIVCNPPYIPIAQRHELPASVIDWEDGDALFSPSGIEFYERIAAIAKLVACPRIVMEIGRDQGDRVCEIFSDIGEVEVRKDLFGNPRSLWVASTGGL
jgi:release factor glutamine methyltransferase